MVRNLCFTHLGPSYQFSPDTISGLPSPLMSAMVQLSLAPRSSVCFSNGISSVRPMAHAARPTLRHTTTAIKCRFMRLIVPLLNARAASKNDSNWLARMPGFPGPPAASPSAQQPPAFHPSPARYIGPYTREPPRLALAEATPPPRPTRPPPACPTSY